MKSDQTDHKSWLFQKKKGRLAKYLFTVHFSKCKELAVNTTLKDEAGALCVVVCRRTQWEQKNSTRYFGEQLLKA